MPWSVERITDWRMLYRRLHELERFGGLAYRGDPEHEERLVTSIDRAFEVAGLAGAEAGVVEQRLIERFRGQAGVHLPPQLLSSLEDAVRCIILMRHYGAPTRLLDWSESIWVAAYFASWRSPERPGSIWVFDRYRYQDLVKKRFGDEPQRATREPRGAFFHAIFAGGAAGPGDRDWVVPLELLDDRFPRLVAQQGFFTIGSRLGIDHGAVIDDLLSAAPGVVRNRRLEISPSLKPRLLHLLERKGITGASLFPGLEGIAFHINDAATYARRDRGMRRAMRAARRGIGRAGIG